MFKDVWVDRLVFELVPLVFLSILMPIPSCFQHCTSVVEFEVRDCDASTSSFIVQDCFGYVEFLLFYMKLRSLEDFAGHFIEYGDCF